MSDLMTCEATRSAISSPVWVDGPVPCALFAGPMTDLFGPVPVRANLSARQAKDLGLMTHGTYGLAGNGSLASDALQRSLESRLQRHLNGSVSCEVIWKRWDTPWGNAYRSRERRCGTLPRSLLVCGPRRQFTEITTEKVCRRAVATA